MNYLIFIIFLVLYFSLEEWLLHKYVMHNHNLKWFTYAYRAHATVHHVKFGYGESYHLPKGESEKKTLIPMDWWNGPVLILIGSLPFLFLKIFLADFLFLGVFSESWWFYGIVWFVGGAYYGTYEYLHWCFHLPKKRRLEKGWIFQKLNGHHLLHHRFMGKNFNVVLPFWDLMFGTLLSRSPICFKQATGSSVPDVQPKKPKV